MLDHFSVSEHNWQDAVGTTAPQDFAVSETPATSAAGSQRWQPTRTYRGLPGRPLPHGPSCANTASPTPTEATQTSAAGSPRYAAPGTTPPQPTRPASARHPPPTPHAPAPRPASSFPDMGSAQHTGRRADQ